VCGACRGASTAHDFTNGKGSPPYHVPWMRLRARGFAKQRCMAREGASGAAARRADGRGGMFARRPAETDADAERLRLFRNYEQMAIGWFWATDAEGRITYLSEGAVR